MPGNLVLQNLTCLAHYRATRSLLIIVITLDICVTTGNTDLMAVVVMTSEAQRQAGQLPMPIFGRMSKLVERLRNWPNVSGAKPLSGRLAHRYRLRTGDYRLQFRVEGEKIVVEKIGHRDRFYEE